MRTEIPTAAPCRRAHGRAMGRAIIKSIKRTQPARTAGCLLRACAIPARVFSVPAARLVRSQSYYSLRYYRCTGWIVQYSVQYVVTVLVLARALIRSVSESVSGRHIPEPKECLKTAMHVGRFSYSFIQRRV